MPNSNTRTSSDSDDKFRLVVEFSTANAAFEDNREMEIDHILRGITHSVYNYENGGTISDSNGNTIGRWYLEEDSKFESEE